MIDFGDALMRGLDAAQRADRAHEEINEVLQTVASDLLVATGKRLAFSVQKFDKNMDPFGIAGNSALLLMRPRPTETWLAIKETDASSDTPWTKLARWELATEGYPCRLIYDRMDVQCHDREALIEGLAAMLSTAWIGDKINRLLATEKS